MILQPSEERRRSGSHYTPRTLTEPIVRKALKPILERLGPHPRPEQILALEVADIAVGSGAFLVETCRQLADVLVAAWHHYDCTPPIPSDEDEVLLAKRTVAQKSLYGVDRNPMAVDLTKLSLWLATLAKDHPFTFLDHSIRCGDSLVGLTRRQIARFSWSDDATHVQFVFGQEDLDKRIEAAARERQKIIEASDSLLPHKKVEHLRKADAALDLVRLAGDCCISAFFEADKDRARQTKREEKAVEFSSAVRSAERGDSSALNVLKEEIRMLKEDPSATPRAAVSLGDRVSRGLRRRARWIRRDRRKPAVCRQEYPHRHQSQRLSGLAQDACTRKATATLTLSPISSAERLRSCAATAASASSPRTPSDKGTHAIPGFGGFASRGGGTIYAARRRYKWPGAAAVVVSVVWVAKGTLPGPFDLDGKSVNLITAYLFHDGGHENPAVLAANAGKSFIGSYVLGMGFTFDDTDKKGVANPLAEMERLIAKDPRNAERIFPYLGGEEVNDSPTHAHIATSSTLPISRCAARRSTEDVARVRMKSSAKRGCAPASSPKIIPIRSRRIGRTCSIS